MTRIVNDAKIMVLTALLGSAAGLVIWCFLKAVSICSVFLWEKIPDITGISFIPLVFCVLFGLAVGVLHRKYGDYPEELSEVMGKIKKDKYYDYHPIAVMMICAFFPLVLGASVGPEAGLTGIVAALCYWIGDNVSFAKSNAAMFSEIGETVTLGQLFHSPLFGILAVEEGDEGSDEGGKASLSRGNKLLLYGISAGTGFLVVGLMNRLLGPAMEGFPSFSEVAPVKEDYFSALIYIPVGLIVFLFFELCEKLTAKIAGKTPVVIREVISGTLAGIMVLIFPVAMFSGEEEMAEMMGTFTAYTPLFLAGICIVKILMTTFCINFGMKGGHFFPLIFSCTSMGMALSTLIFTSDPMSHAAFAAATVTATVLGAQIKKPFAVSLLLLLCFPLNTLFWIFFCAAVGARVMKPRPSDAA